MATRPARFLLALTLPFTGCAFHQHVRAGNTAVESHDWATATAEYRAACERRPKRTDVCDQAEKVGQRALAFAIQQADKACDAKDFERCLGAVEPARPLFPDDPKIWSIIERAAALRLEQCRSERTRTAEEALDVLKCLHQTEKRLDSPKHSAAIRDVEASAAATFNALSQESTQTGARWAYATVARCIDPAPGSATGVGLAGQKFLDDASVRFEPKITVAGKKTLPPAFTGLCPDAIVGVEGALCDPEPNRTAAYTLDVLATLQPSIHRVAEQPMSARYVRATEMQPNPAYDAAITAQSDAKRAYADYEPEFQKAKLECELADKAWKDAGACAACDALVSKEKECAEAQSSRAIFDRREKELLDARRAVASTPTMVETPIYANFAYVVKQHRWVAPWTLAFGKNAGERDIAGEIVFEDTEQPGFPAANLQADPLSEPSADGFDQKLSAALQRELHTRLVDELERRAKTRRAECNPRDVQWKDAWLQCRLEADLWDPAIDVDASALRPPGVCDR